MNRGHSALTLLKRHSSVLTPGYRQRQFNNFSTSELVEAVTQWVQECTGILCDDKPLLAYLYDGTVLCKLIQTIQPGLIKRTNRIKNPFAWRENILFFLEACQKLGLRDSDLFTPEELYEENKGVFTHYRSISQETRLRRVCESLYCLGLIAAEVPDYTGPTLTTCKGDKGKEFSSTRNLPSEISKSPYTITKPPPAVRKARSFVSLVTTNNSANQQSFAETIFNSSQSSQSVKPKVVGASTTAFNKPNSLGQSSVLTPPKELNYSPPIPTLSFNDPQFSVSVESKPFSVPDNGQILKLSPHNLSKSISDPDILNHTRCQDTLNCNPEGNSTFNSGFPQKFEDCYPNHCSDHHNLSQQVLSTNAELSSILPPVDTSEDSLRNSPNHLTVMSTTKDLLASCSDPENIPIIKPRNSQSSIPHHCLDVGEADTSSYQDLMSNTTDAREQEVEVVFLAGEETLGFSLEENTNGLLSIKAVEPGSAASRADLQCEDELLSVDNTSLANTPLSTALSILRKAKSADKFVLHIRRAKEVSQHAPHYKSLRPPDLLDMSRVTSDALPHSLIATTVHVDSVEPSDFVIDSATEIMSSPDVPTDSPERDITNENRQTQENCIPNGRGTVPYITKNSRPLSAPSKSRSSTAMSIGKSHTLPNKSSSVSRLVKDHQAAEREKSFQSNAQILLKYAQSRQTTGNNWCQQRGSLSPTQSKLFKESDDDHQAAEGSPSPEVQSRHSTTSLTNAGSICSSNSTPLNLRHISMDETRIASVIQMDSIWRQVESGDDSSNLDAQSSAATFDLSFSVGDKNTDESALTFSNQLVDPHIHRLTDTPSNDSEPQGTAATFAVSPPLATSSPLRTTTPPLRVTTSESTAAESTLAVGSHSLSTISDSQTKERPASFSSKDIDSLLTTLKSLGTPNESVDELKVLEQMLKSNTFKKAKKIHDLMHQLLLNADASPVYRRIVPSTQLLRQTLRNIPGQDRDVEQLRSLLRHPHIQALLFCHDKVSTHDLYMPDVYFHKAAQDPVDKILSESLYHFDTANSSHHHSMPLSRDIPSGRKEGAVIVFVERTTKPLGITLYKQEESVFIGKLISGCDAEASNVLREGDELLEVNGMPIWDKTTDHIITLMSPGRIEEGDNLVLTIIPVHDGNIDLDYEIKYIRAHFNYNGRLDEEIPCKALGLSFQKGDILEVSNQDDPNWWQARKVFDDGAESLPGLIPSRHLQQQREALVRSYPFNFSGSKLKKGIGLRFTKKKKKKVFYQSTSTTSSVGVGDEVPTYEEVVRLNPGQSPNRPVILIGAPRVGKRALIRELISSNTSLFSRVVSHTSRSPRPGEVEGQDYFFVTREEFESDMHRDRFLEHEEYKGAYYGTSFTSIKRIMESSRIPVLDVHPQALKKLRYSGLQPYVIFVASPRLERLQFTRQIVSEKGKKSFGGAFSWSSTHEEFMYTELELKQMLEESLHIESQYGHYFDWIIVNDDFQVASDMLKEVVRRMGEESQWIPALWKYDRY